MRKTSGSRRISSAIASRSASRMVWVIISVPSGTSGSGSATGAGAGPAFGAEIIGFPPPTGEREAASSWGRLGGGAGGLGRLGRGHFGEIRGGLAIGQNGCDRRVDVNVGGAFRNQDLAELAFVG